MKTFAKIFVVALVVALFASIFSITSSASTSVDPMTLKPGSDRVVFIMDAPENGILPGNGTGDDPQNPLQAVDHDKFFENDEFPRYYYQTELYQATEMLQETGGTIVIMGPVLIGRNETYGNSETTQEFLTAEFKTNTIKFTSVYNGVDYRKTNGAKLILSSPAVMGIQGQSIWENIDIVTDGEDRLIAFHYWSTLIGEGVKNYPKDDLLEGINTHHVSITAGHRHRGGDNLVTNLVVQSGSYNNISAGMWGVNTARPLKEEGKPSSGYLYTNNMDGKSVTNITLEGTTTVYGSIVGTTYKNAEYSGKVNITINDGTYKCDVYGIGASGMLNRDGVLMLRINGGDFTKAWSIESVKPEYSNNLPYLRVIDFSGWKGEKAALAKAYSLAKKSETEFTSIKLPSGVTEAELEQLAAQTTPATQGSTNSSGGNKKPIKDFNDYLNDAKDNNDENKGGNLGLIIGIVAGVVVLVAVVVVVVVVLGKKKKTNE
ncbi:MAG: hypothetical protein IJ292_01640 [Clostridia bacterium]|nr:hypothetical protein [Clostridia bacterium]